LVKNIQAGCELYKQAKESFVEIKRTADEVVAIGKEVKGIWETILEFFNSKPKAQVAKPVAKTKRSDYVAVDETQVKIDIVKNLTEFFKLQEQLAAHIREEEEKSKNVYDPDQNLMESALNRVMAQQEMDSLVIQIRECMVYQSPPEMGALYSEVFGMREKIEEEQTQARLKEEAKKRQELWQQRQLEKQTKITVAWVLAVIFLAGYLHLWFLYLTL